MPSTPQTKRIQAVSDDGKKFTITYQFTPLHSATSECPHEEQSEDRSMGTTSEGLTARWSSGGQWHVFESGEDGKFTVVSEVAGCG